MAAQAVTGGDGSGALLHAAWEIARLHPAGASSSACRRAICPAACSRVTRPWRKPWASCFLTAGLALWLDLSFLLSGIACGAMVVNTGRHHNRPFHEVEHIEWPFMIFFFVLAGASLETRPCFMKLGHSGRGLHPAADADRPPGGWLASGAGSPAGRARQRSYLFGLSLLPQAGRCPRDGPGRGGDPARLPRRNPDGCHRVHSGVRTDRAGGHPDRAQARRGNRAALEDEQEDGGET